MKVGGLDLAKRSDFSALVTLEVESGRLTVTRALRLSQDRYDRQLAAVAPILADLDALAYDAGGVGDAVGERLPIWATPILIVAGDRPPILRNGRWQVGKLTLIQNVLVLAGSGRLAASANAPGEKMLREELARFTVRPTRTGVRMAAQGQAHDDLVMALALAVMAVRLRAEMGAKAGN
jgi:hypothetical protein